MLQNIIRHKLNKKKIILDACIISLLLVGITFATYFIYSNVVVENVSQYTLTLTSSDSSPIKYENVTFSATLDLGSNPAPSGLLIHFYQDNNEVGTALTDSNGMATFEINMTNVGSLNFKAGYEVP